MPVAKSKPKTAAKAPKKAAKAAAPVKNAPAKKAVKVVVPMTKAQYIATLAEEVNLTKPQAKAALEAVVDIACKGAKSKECAVKGFTIPGLGKLVKAQRKAGWARNPQTGERIKTKARTVVKFRLAKACKDAVLGTKA